MTKIEQANAVIDNIRKETSEVGLMLSFGKDSLVTLDKRPQRDLLVYYTNMTFYRSSVILYNPSAHDSVLQISKFCVISLDVSAIIANFPGEKN